MNSPFSNVQQQGNNAQQPLDPQAIANALLQALANNNNEGRTRYTHGGIVAGRLIERKITPLAPHATFKQRKNWLKYCGQSLGGGSAFGVRFFAENIQLSSSLEYKISATLQIVSTGCLAKSMYLCLSAQFSTTRATMASF